MARYDYVLFDADNTLFDFDAAERAALHSVFSARGYPFTPETEAVYQAINKSLWAAYARGETTQEALTTERFRLLIDRLGGGHDPAALNRDFLDKLAEGTMLLPGACAAVEALSPHCTLAIVTNGVTAVQRRRFEHSPITRYFKDLFISQELGLKKPDARFFDHVADALGITDRRRAVVVGDTPETDLRGGINAGIDTIWYNPCGGSCDPPPTWEVTALSQLSAIIL